GTTMLICGECRQEFERAEERAKHRKEVHPDSKGFARGGFCAFCDHQAGTLFDGLDHLVACHVDRWRMMTGRVEMTYGVKMIHFDRQYTIAEAALSLSRTYTTLEVVLAKIDTLAEVDDEEEDVKPETKQQVADEGQSDGNDESDEDNKQLQQHYESISQLINRIPTFNTPLPPPTKASHSMPVLAALLNNQEVQRDERGEEISRKRGIGETLSSNGAGQGSKKKPCQLEILPFKIEEEDDDIVILDSPEGAPKVKRQANGPSDITEDTIKMEVDYVTAFPNLPPVQPANCIPFYTQPLHVQPPSTPVSSLPFNVAMLTPESSVHTNSTQLDDDAIDSKPQHRSSAAHHAQSDLDERKFLDSGSTVSSSSGSSISGNFKQIFPMQPNHFGMSVLGPQFQVMAMNQSMGGPLPMMNLQYFPEAVAPAAPATPLSQWLPIPTNRDVNIEFWDKDEPGQCPNCGEKINGKSTAKKNHFKKLHYDIFFLKVKNRHRHQNLEQLLRIRLGGDKNDSRVCLCCEVPIFANGRRGMIAHLQHCHPQNFTQFCNEYAHCWRQITPGPFGTTPPDETIHNIVCNEIKRCFSGTAISPQ
ncbi:hypothetical protein PMAYCL1PPCAC_28264, partial [Pristionchus mayeri]